METGTEPPAGVGTEAPSRRNPFARAFQLLERRFDRVFGAAQNPLRQLGALGFYFFWMVIVSGIYVYVFFDTSVAGAYRSLEALATEQRYAGGLMRSLHRYASDAFAAAVALHFARELAYGRFAGFRWFSWVSSAPLIWLGLAAGIGGYWLVWDQLAQFIGIAVTEWFGWLPGFGVAMVRNFIVADTLSDRLFSLLVFLHIGIPLLLLLGMWVHIQRIARPRTWPDARLGLGLFASLLVLSLARPALSQPPADLAAVPLLLQFDWFYLFPAPLLYRGSPGALWLVATAATLALMLLPWVVPGRRPPVAQVDPANCNGCGRCFADCPYGAVVLIPRADGRAHLRQAAVLPDLCASCGICAGACPSATPFRKVAEFGNGIDLPQLRVGALRLGLQRALAGLNGKARVVAFGCDRGADIKPLAQAAVATFSLPCIGMLPPSFVEYALRGGADGVFVTGCGEGDCEYQCGDQLTRERIEGRREPHFRTRVARERLRLAFTGDAGVLEQELANFRAALCGPMPAPPSPPPRRRKGAHG
jgi:coenzyme F420-reducing hydrogenase delta subunit/ferredoxin